MPAADPRAMSLGDRLIWAGQAFFVLLMSWLILDGLKTVWLGVLVAGAAAALAAALAPDRPHRWLPWRLIGFAGFFLVESFRGGFDVAWRALHPGLPIDPGFCRHRLALPAGQPRTLMVSVVSLLPGTLSADLEDEGDTLVVHSLMPNAEEASLRLERWIAWLFALPEPAP